MGKLFGLVSATIIIIAIIYLAAAFVALRWDPSHWAMQGRLVAAVVSVVGIVLAVIIVMIGDQADG